ncbi:MBL fold metallo-hydrolase [Hippea maritima]|uniref:Beta-lactamase domain protein n=1 Tax=Hippea maritima (strain ATCC 700847 / DSM 10411 / MH2) TaxID=760142 RepID=F2LXB4_HIPMA|nr:MBL fold metallo-hydrolase [Hippea maritima]AEA34228.1 beta-lactamase domain protein [Hippea maritima DSM 10411]
MVVKVVVGELEENCYLVFDESSKECTIIDPGDEPEKIIGVIEKYALTPTIILNTHYHFDHVGANAFLKKRYNIKLAIHENDLSLLKKAHIDAKIFLLKDQEPSPEPDILLKDGDIVDVGSLSFEVLHTPGHTPGSVCFYEKNKKWLFSGDTLFFESVGRWDFPSGSKNDLLDSLKRLIKLPDDVLVYPGHGEPTTIEHERKLNPYIDYK